MNLLIIIFTAIATFLIANRLIDLLIEFLNVRKSQFRKQEQLIVEFEKLSLKFLKITNDKSQPLTRGAVVCMPAIISNGALAQHFFAFQVSGDKSMPDDKEFRKSRIEFNKLSDEQRDLLSNILGCGLLASTYSLPVTGRLVRQSLSTVMDSKNHRVNSPNRVVARVRAVAKDNRPQKECGMVLEAA